MERLELYLAGGNVKTTKVLYSHVIIPQQVKHGITMQLGNFIPVYEPRGVQTGSEWIVAYSSSF